MTDYRKHTDEESPGESPFLDAADDGEREPVSRNEGMQKRHRRNSSDCGQIFCSKTFHLPPKRTKSLARRRKNRVFRYSGRISNRRNGIGDRSSTEIERFLHRNQSGAITLIPELSSVCFGSVLLNVFL